MDGGMRELGGHGLGHRHQLSADQHEIAGDRGLAAAGRLKVHRLRRSHRGRHLHAAVMDRLGPRDAV